MNNPTGITLLGEIEAPDLFVELTLKDSLLPLLTSGLGAEDAGTILEQSLLPLADTCAGAQCQA